MSVSDIIGKLLKINLFDDPKNQNPKTNETIDPTPITNPPETELTFGTTQDEPRYVEKGKKGPERVIESDDDIKK